MWLPETIMNTFGW